MANSFDWLTSEFAARLGPAIAAMAGQESVAAAAAEPHPRTHSPDDIVWQQDTGLMPGADLCVHVPAALWRELGAKILEGAGLPEAEESEVRGTFLEIIQQALSGLATSMGSKVGREINLPPGSNLDSPQRDQWQAVAVELAGQSAGTFWLSAGTILTSLLDAAAAAAAAPPPSATSASSAASAANAASSRPSFTLDLLLDVELPVGVSFGRSQMKLKDAVKLTTGSIVELNRSITEPVEIIVNNCVIARGEVVVVEGNYGVRIRQIVSREERLRTLF